MFTVFYHLTGIAHGDGVSGNITDDNRTGTNRCAVADGDAGQHRHAASYPHVVADPYGARPLHAGVALLWIGGVTSRQQTHVGPDEHIVADRYLGLIENDEIEIGEEAVAHLDVAAIVAIERRVDDRTLTATAQHLAQSRLALLKAGGLNLIVAPHAVFIGKQTFQHHRVVAVVGLSAQHFFPFGHKCFFFAKIQKISRFHRYSTAFL